MLRDYPFLTAPEGGYVFVVTYGRSGSTLLQNLLNALPGYCIRGENSNATSHLARSIHALEQTPQIRDARRKGTRTAPTHPWFGAEGIDTDTYARGLCDLFVREVLHLPEGTRVGGFKEIRYVQDHFFIPTHLHFLLRYFPKAKIIFNTRNHASVAKSGWWADQDPAEVARRLHKAEARFTEVQATFPDQTLHLHYDDYVADPARLAALFDFLGETYDPALVARIMDHKLRHLARDTTPAPQHSHS